MKNLSITTSLCSKYLLSIVAIIIVSLTATSVALSIPRVILGSTSNFTILAGAGVTGIPPVAITGNVGLSPAAGSFITGFDGSNVTGTLYVVDASGPAGSVVNSVLLQTAKSDLTIAMNDAAGRTPVPTGTFLNPGSANIGGLNLVAGLYKFTSACAITGSDVTLTGNATDVWIFQIGTSLNVGSGIKVTLSGGALASNIFWQVGTSATIGTTAEMKGTIMAGQSVTLGTGAKLDGRALAFSASVTMASGVNATKPDTGTTAGPIFFANPLKLAFANVNVGIKKKDSVTVKNTGTGNLNITSVTSSNARFAATPLTGTIAAGSTMKFYVTFTPANAGLQKGSIVFNHNASNNKDTIEMSGTGATDVNSAIFAANKTNIDFGTVKIESSKLESVTVSNTGTSKLIISGISVSDNQFIISPVSGDIAPGASMEFYVTYAPTDAIQSSAVITFNSNGGEGTLNVTGLGESTNSVNDNASHQYSLSKNYPNPFTTSTVIQYTLEAGAWVSLKIFDISGNEIATLVDGYQDAGNHTESFSIPGNPLQLSSNIYYYRLKVGNSFTTKQMIFIK